MCVLNLVLLLSVVHRQDGDDDGGKDIARGHMKLRTAEPRKLLLHKMLFI